MAWRWHRTQHEISSVWNGSFATKEKHVFFLQKTHGKYEFMEWTEKLPSSLHPYVLYEEFKVCGISGERIHLAGDERISIQVQLQLHSSYRPGLLDKPYSYTSLSFWKVVPAIFHSGVKWWTFPVKYSLQGLQTVGSRSKNKSLELELKHFCKCMFSYVFSSYITCFKKDPKTWSVSSFHHRPLWRRRFLFETFILCGLCSFSGVYPSWN